MGPTCRPNLHFIQPSQKVLFARPLEFFKSILRPQYKILGPILCLVTICWLKKVSISTGLRERGRIMCNFGVGRKYLQLQQTANNSKKEINDDSLSGLPLDVVLSLHVLPLMCKEIPHIRHSSCTGRSYNSRLSFIQV